MNKKYLIIFSVICIVLVGVVFLFFNREEEYEYVNIVQDTSNLNEENTKETETIKVHILGEVRYNGILELEVGSRVADAIEKAGGVTESADVSKVNLAYILEDGEKIYIPNVNDEDTDFLISETSSQKININTADEEELENIPGVGPSLAKSIIDYRKENGRFTSIEDIKNVSGVGESKYKKMEEYIKIK